jgi:hypothetical protein
VLKNQVTPLLFIALHIIIFPPLAEYSRVLTLACDVVQLRKSWSSTMMMVPMLKQHPSWAEILVVSVVDGASADADLLAVFVIHCFRPTGPCCKTYFDVKLCTNALYSDICSYILITIDNVTSCMYCGIHVGAPGLLLKPGVKEVVSKPYQP